MSSLVAFELTPIYRQRVWGGQRLKAASPPIGEAWLVYEENLVAVGPYAGRSLADVTALEGEALLGRRGGRLAGGRFPLLIKLLDCADWLSVQVHPNDQQALEREGPGYLGKTEAWHILEATPEAQVIAGLRPGASAAKLAQSLREGTLLNWLRYLPAQAGETIFIPAGTVHALGPGILLYEVQQTSDLTYRLYDWDRPAAGGRALHLEKSLAAIDPQAGGQPIPAAQTQPDGRYPLVNCPYFHLELLTAHRQSLTLDTEGESFHALTILEGQAQMTGDGWDRQLGRFGTIVVPAGCDHYHIKPLTHLRLLKVKV
ncbi:MAG: type I phosphomannose isomerase catalytic subunit [Chloroflexota bacterium]